jgi:adenylate cyclase class IV
MIEARAVVESVEKARNSVESLGAEFKSDYAFKDIIYVPKKADYNLSDDFLRVRVMTKRNWPTKDVILVRKQTEWKEHGKLDNIVLREEFDTEEEAVDYIDKHLSTEFERGFEYSREGWQYQLGDSRIFVEDIGGYGPSVEVEADTEQQLQDILDKIGVKEVVKESVPEIMRKIKEKSN